MRFFQLIAIGCGCVLALHGAACGPTHAEGNDNWQLNHNTGQDGGVQPDASQQQDGWVWPDTGTPDAGNVYQLDGALPTDGCPPEMSNPCPNPGAPGCQATEVCGNGLDDNCNGQADEFCACVPGDVQQCFIGPPGFVNVGACVMGNQVCQGSQEMGQWGPCEGGIWPSAEVCDDLDNDCNGCADDGLCCDPPISCPGPGDILEGQPFTTYPLDGTQWYTGTATSWSWTVEGGPCDQLFVANGHSPSYTVNGANTATPTIEFTLSGDYTVTMTVVTPGGTYSCTFIIHVTGPGLRVELCWENTGLFGNDIDLHLLRESANTSWCDDAEDCYYMSCQAYNWDLTSWGMPNSPLSECVGGPDGAAWQSNFNACPNPRLDVDNISDPGIPENINIDAPVDGETYRVMAHYFSSGFTSGDHPLVNIYCDGYRVATYGQAPNTVNNFTTSGGFGCQGNTWRVADVETLVSGGVTTCNVSALHPPGQATGFDVRYNDTSY